MPSEYQIVKQVYAAKENMQAADDLIRSYIPFIKSEASKFLSRIWLPDMGEIADLKD